MTQLLTGPQLEAIGYAVTREVYPTAHLCWDEIGDHTIADLCSANQDACIDGWFDYYHEHTEADRREIAELVAVYDSLLGTNRVAELTEPTEPTEPTPGAPA